MAKKEVAPEFNMSEAIREVLKSTPKASAKETSDAIQAKYPGVTLNKNSFSVAFYTIKKKLFGGKSSRKPAKASDGRRVTGTSSVSFDALKHAANLVREVGSLEAAMDALKAVKTIQID